MPFKHHDPNCRQVPKMKSKVTNWAEGTVAKIGWRQSYAIDQTHLSSECSKLLEAVGLNGELFLADNLSNFDSIQYCCS